ncbi:MAG: molybdopterin molybdotransferase MoeA [Syntrophomonadaceae bacterium]|nr:molybdopterin molybdotransferase MoeA [Syntrophomonadaceae bacterium]
MLLDINLELAQSIILSHIPSLASEELPLMESFGRVLAMDYAARHDLPMQARSAVDGYALAVGEAPVNSSFLLKVVPSNEAAVISEDEAMAVTTGGSLPEGTQAVVPHEKTLLQDGKLSVLESIKPGANIKTSGEDYRQGEILATTGTIIDGGVAAALAAFGYSRINVRVRPRVAVLALGNSIVPFDVSPEPHQMRDSNGPMLAAMISQDGCETVSIEVADSIESADKVLRHMLSRADMVVCTGGTYARGTDEARQILEGLGVELFYWGVPIQPGSHHGAGRYQNALVLALSGNPAACAVGYHLFASPALNSMQGLTSLPQIVQARCINGFAKKSGSRRFVRGHAEYVNGGWQVEVLPGQKPSMLKSLLNCNALIDLPAGTPPVGIDDEITIWLL